jgi:hypothetical protein
MPNPSHHNAADEALIRAMQREVANLKPADRAKWEPKTKAAKAKAQKGKK